MQVLKSVEDASVNFVKAKGEGFLESRFVQRCPEYFVCYLSSQNGCKHACRMCHLTQTGQTMDMDATVADFMSQSNKVLAHADTHAKMAKVVHYNFMARGEPLACRTVLNNWPAIAESLTRKAVQRGLRPRFLISTILPKALEDSRLVDIFPVHHPEIYWSLYSTWPAVRQKWLPNALPPFLSAAMLAEWQQDTNKIPKVHFAFIKGVNDCEAAVEDIAHLLNTYHLHVNFNIVRYNPPDSKSEEADEETIRDRVDQLENCFPHSRVDVIPRVGFDVQASCGMFVSGANQ
jgi:adenine C2-methylase RlmN of 23S rRNA A2503 and tRNA A37